MHVIFHPIFALIVLWFISKELKFKYQPKKHIIWLVYGVIAGVIALVLNNLLDQSRLANFLLHSIGGGVATAFTFEYLKQHMSVKFKWYIELAILFAFVSSFGVINEIYEYLLELMNIMISSWDTHDTWRDLVANTLGGFTGWLVIKLIKNKS